MSSLKLLLLISVALLYFIPEVVSGIEANMSTADDSPQKVLERDILEFFTRREARILSVEGNTIKIDKGFNDGVRRFMRFEVLSSRTIKHPVTQEEIGIADIKTGTIEVTETYEDYSLARLLHGEAVPQGRVTVPSVSWKVYLQEEKGVDYFIADEYYRVLRSTGLFEFVNERASSDIIITLSLRTDGGIQKIRQSVAWSDTNQEFLETEAEVSNQYLERLKKEKALYEQELKGADLLLSFRLSGSVRFINIADVDGDNSSELIIATDKSIEIYRLGISLKGLYEIKLKGEPLGVFPFDINKDGKAEIIVPVLLDNKVYSEIYKLVDGELRSIYRTDGYLRSLGDRLFIQGFSPDEGISGEMSELIPDTNPTLRHGEILTNSPIHADISGIAFIRNEKNYMTLAYDEQGHLNLFDQNGKLLWRSKEDTGGFFYTFEKLERSPILPAGTWSLKDRILVEGDIVYIIKRRPVAGVAKGLGWSSSEIVSLRWNGKEMESQVIKEVGGAILDFFITPDRLYILQKPFMGISIGSILKGENPKQTRLYIFKRP